MRWYDDWFPEIFPDTPLEKVREIHKDIWNNVITYGIKPQTPYPNDCVLCAYARAIQNTITFRREPVCSYCPADWAGYGPCDWPNSLMRQFDKIYRKPTVGWEFNRWWDDEEVKPVRKIAMAIRDVHFRDL